MTPLSFLSRLLLLFLLCGAMVAVMPETSSAQSLEEQDLSEVTANDISDTELRRYMRRAESEGISESEAFRMARQRGMAQSEIDALRRRVEDMQMEELEDAEPEEEVRERPEIDEPEAPDPAAPAAEEVMERIYGHEIFTAQQISFEPAMNIPTPKNYQLGTGDELIIDIWGDTQNTYRVEVNNEGHISLENLGPIYVNGLTIEEADERIRDHLKQLYSGLRDDNDRNTNAQISLGRVRSINVTLIGEISSPGTYTVSSLATVFNALYQSGGPSRNGSMRSIRVIRENELVAELDLYNFLLHGEHESANIRLRDQDVILVDPYETRVDVEGEVRRPGLYETMEDESLEDLISFAGGFTDQAYTRNLRVHRNTPTQRQIITVKNEGFGDFNLHDGDRIRVDEILDRYENRVEIDGAVWRPGEFELTEDMTLHELIEEADGLRPDAFQPRGHIYRLQDDFSTEVVSFDVRRIMEDPESYDIELRADDEVRIPTIFDMREGYNVNIQGEVQNGGNYDYRENMTLEDLIFQADGFREAASEAKIEVARRIEGDPAPDLRSNQLSRTFSFEVNRDLSLEEEAQEFELEPFDQVYVRRRPDYQPQRNVTVEGELLYPGDYSLKKRDERISEVIERAGGLTDEAYPEGATIIRRRDAEASPEVDLDLDVEAEDEIIEADVATEEMRVGIDLVSILEDPDSDEDLYLREGDVLRIPDEPQTVRVTGAVLHDAEVRYREGYSYSDYINQAGGYQQNARRRSGYVVYLNGEVDRRRSFLYITSSPEVKPGSEIIVPEKPERERLSTGEIVSISSAVVSMATSVVIAIDRIYR